MKPTAFGCLFGLCIGPSLACDRSWREEQFVAPSDGPSETQERPRVRPSVTPSANFGTTSVTVPGTGAAGSDAGALSNPSQAGATDAGRLEGDASLEPNQPDESDPLAPSSNGIDQPGHEGATSAESTPSPSGPGEPVELEPFSKAALLRATAACAVEQYEAFAQHAHALSRAVALLNEQSSALPDAQQAFVDAILSFQIVEQFRIGPAARAMDPGGKDLRDWLYAYPQINRCQVDRNLVSEVYLTDFDDVLLNARGLGVLEYLLFERGDSNTCSVGIDINVHGSWAELSQAELDARRAEYAGVVADDIARRADELVAQWVPSEGNFHASLVDAGSGSGVFASQQAALNAVSHALFYLEKEVKDYKLGWPLGLVAECTSGSCPGAAELPYSGQSGPSISQNLRGFRLLFEGCGADYAGIGFDDWLRAADPDGDLGERMLLRLTEAESAVSALPRLLEDAFYDAPDEARAVHAAVKKVTDLLKTEFVTVLNLDLPMTAEGDND